jgi:adenylyltransferase/sulfurtransferase
MKIKKEQLYSRQTTLTEIGEEGQQKIVQSKVVIFGCGGLGSTAAVYLAASGIGTIDLVDYDKVDVSNLHRQVFYKTEDIGKSKVQVLANHIKSISPFVKVSYTNKAVSKENVFELISLADYILDCTDSLPVKYLLNDACVLKDKPLIYGSLYKFDGYVSSFNVKRSDSSRSSNLRDAFPEISKEAIPNCSEIGTLNTIVGIIAMMQANELLKLVTSVGIPLVDKLLIYNSLDNSQHNMQLKSSFSKQKIQEIFDVESYFDANCEIQDEILLISAKALRQKLSYGEASQKLYIISVDEDTNVKDPFFVHQKIPLSKLDPEKQRFVKDNEYVIVCKKGISSYIATQRIKATYPKINVLSLKNGITNY